MAECCRACPGMPFPLQITSSPRTIWTPSSTWFLVSTRVHISNGISISSAVFPHLSTTECPYTLHWAAPSPSNLPIPMSWSGPPSTTWFSGTIRALNPTASWLVQTFLHSSPQIVPILYNEQPLSPSSKLPLPRRIWSPSNAWFLGPTRPHNSNGISIGSAVFAGFTTVTDRQTDDYSVCNNRPHL